MPTLRTLGCLLLASTALSAVPAFAQSTTQSVPRTQPPSGETAADAPDPDEDTIDSATPGAPQDASDDNVDISAPGSSDFGNEIIVQGRYIPQPVRDSGQVVNVLSTEEIARAGDGDIAGALGRVTGLSVTNNGFVFVRGLGDRYSLALLNGLALPSPEPLRRVVPLDLFPTSVVSSAVVQKSYSVNYPGEFGGGVINLTTPAIPDENYFTIGAGISGDTKPPPNSAIPIMAVIWMSSAMMTAHAAAISVRCATRSIRAARSRSRPIARGTSPRLPSWCRFRPPACCSAISKSRPMRASMPAAAFPFMPVIRASG